MSLEEQYTQLINTSEKAEAQIFLKSLNVKQKKEFAPFLKKIVKVYLDYQYIQTGNSTRAVQKATETQRIMLLEAAFVCLSRKDFERLHFSTWYLGQGPIDKILEWYCPTWFDAYINDFASSEWVPANITYEWVMDLKYRGLLHPSEHLVVKVLPAVIYESTVNHRHIYKPEVLRQWPETLAEHIWLLFEFDSNVNWSNRYLHIQSGLQMEETGWIDVFKEYTSSGEIDRQRVLACALLATNRNFNKTLSGWFAELFLQLKPTTQELLILQDHLLSTFNSPHSKPVNMVLNFFKNLVGEKEFKTQEFLDYTPLLLASATKSTVTSTVMILEKLAKKFPAFQGQIVQQAFQTFLHHDDALQTRAAKLIQKYGTPTDAFQRENYAQYEENMFSGVKTLLQEYKAEETVGDEELPYLDAELVDDRSISSKEQIPSIDSLDDLIFLCSQAFDNNEPYHIDLLPAALIEWQNKFTDTTIATLEPGFQRAYQLLLNVGSARTGLLDNLLATFFVDYARLLMNKFPAQASSLVSVHESFAQKDFDNHKQWGQGLQIGSLESWKTYNNDVVFEPHRQVLKAALLKLSQQDDLPLLSTPTHAPCWIDPLELVKRLHLYQAKNQVPHQMDFQLALSRCWLGQPEEALAAVPSLLLGEYERLLLFLLQKDAAPQEPFTHQAAWMVAALTKAPLSLHPELESLPFSHLSPTMLTGQYSWETQAEEYTYDTYDYRIGKMVKATSTHKVLKLHVREKAKLKVESGLKGMISKLFSGSVKTGSDSFLYQHLNLKNGLPWSGESDVIRLLHLVPNHPETLIGQITAHHLKYSTFSEENDKRIVTKVLQALLELWNNLGSMGHLFLATCMVTSDKTVRAYAAEIWGTHVPNHGIDSGLLGEIIGIHERIEFAPLKRFTDLVLSNMFQISDQHNRALELLIQNLLSQLPDAPIKNLKILLQLYVEVLAMNKSHLKDEFLISRLAIWSKSPSLKKIIERLEQRISSETVPQTI